MLALVMLNCLTNTKAYVNLCKGSLKQMQIRFPKCWRMKNGQNISQIANVMTLKIQLIR